jgi:hypothetical protein
MCQWHHPTVDFVTFKFSQNRQIFKSCIVEYANQLSDYSKHTAYLYVRKMPGWLEDLIQAF